MNNPSPVATGQDAVLELLGDIGTFVTVARRIRSGSYKSLKEARGGLDGKTFRRVCRAVARSRGLDAAALYEVNDGMKGENASGWVKLTELGAQALEDFEAGVVALTQAVMPAARTQLAAHLVLEDQAMLDDFVGPIRRASASHGSSPTWCPRSRIMSEVQDAANAFAAAILWAGRELTWAGGCTVEQLGPVIPLGVVCQSASRLARGADGIESRSINLRRVKGRVSVAYPKWLSFPKESGPELSNYRPKDTLAEVLLEAVTGVATFGIVPDLPDVIDPYRLAGRLQFARLAPSDRWPTSVALTMVTVHGREHPDHARVRDAVSDVVRQVVEGSSLDRPAKRRNVPTAPGDYPKHLHSYYIATQTGDTPKWRRERLEFTSMRATAAEGEKPVGRHVLRFEGEIVDLEREVVDLTKKLYTFTGGVLSRSVLYLVADSRELVSVGDEEFYLAFLAFFPFFREYRGKRVWAGAYVARDELRHPLTAGMILSDQPLSDAELDVLSRESRIRSVMDTSGHEALAAAA